MRAFAGTGVIGAYTTFSALNLAMVDGSPRPEAVLGLLVSIGGGCVAAWLGLRVGLSARRAVEAPGEVPGSVDPRDGEEDL